MRRFSRCLVVAAIFAQTGVAEAHPNHSSAVPDAAPWHYLHPDHSGVALLLAIAIFCGILVFQQFRKRPKYRLARVRRIDPRG